MNKKLEYDHMYMIWEEKKFKIYNKTQLIGYLLPSNSFLSYNCENPTNEQTELLGVISNALLSLSMENPSQQFYNNGNEILLKKFMEHEKFLTIERS